VSPSKFTDREAAEKHRYRWLDGTPLINVTAISNLLDDGKSAAFAGAAVKLERQGVNYREEWNARAEIGTRVHGHCEAFLRGEDIEQAAEEKGYVDALEKWIVTDDPQVIEQEAIVLSQLGYGGRFDILCRIGGETALIDLKAGKKYPVEHSLQLSAYANADGLAVFNPAGMLIGVRDLPPIDWCACLYVRADGTYDLDRYPAGDDKAGDDTFGIFCGLLSAYCWTRTDDMKALTKDAIALNKLVSAS
jgi:hypothetical protein